MGVAKQTLLYWFPSKDDLVQAVLVAAAQELSVVIDAAVRAATDDPLDRIEAVIRAVFRPAVRRPALLGSDPRGQPPASAAGDRLTADLARWSIGRWPTCSTRWTPAACAARIPPRRVAVLRHGHRHRHRAGSTARGRLAAVRRRPAPPPQRDARVPPRRPRPVAPSKSRMIRLDRRSRDLPGGEHPLETPRDHRRRWAGDSSV